MRRTSIRTPAIAGFKRSLTSMRKAYFEESEARPLLRQILSAVEKMHMMGVVHRDLNPSNVFVHFPEAPPICSPVDSTSSGSPEKQRGKWTPLLTALQRPTYSR